MIDNNYLDRATKSSDKWNYKLDKEIDKALRKDIDGTVLSGLAEYNEHYLDDHIKAVKTVILEALKAEMPKRKKSVENMGNEMGGSFIGDDYNELYRAEDFGYNQAIDDCLEVCNKLLGDSNAE